MNRLGIICFLAATMMLVSCGKDPLTDPTGSWTAKLTPTQGGATALVFNDTLSTNANQATVPGYTQSSVTATNLNITTNNGCLSNSASQVAGFSSDATSNSFVLTISGTGSVASGNNVLIMQGTLGTETITGAWTLNPVTPPVSGTSPCAGGGTFSMKLVSGSSFSRSMGG